MYNRNGRVSWARIEFLMTKEYSRPDWTRKWGELISKTRNNNVGKYVEQSCTPSRRSNGFLMSSIISRLVMAATSLQLPSLQENLKITTRKQ